MQEKKGCRLLRSSSFRRPRRKHLLSLAREVAMAKKIKSKALQFVYDRYIGEDRALAAAFEEELLTADIASQIYNLRKRAGLSQRQLAAKVGTTASVICRLEDSDYDGHSLSMLKRIAAALGRQVKVLFVPVGRRRATA
jgi:ribosome-binding protein aMBF1 (putative translation factor)